MRVTVYLTRQYKIIITTLDLSETCDVLLSMDADIDAIDELTPIFQDIVDGTVDRLLSDIGSKTPKGVN